MAVLPPRNVHENQELATVGTEAETVLKGNENNNDEETHEVNNNDSCNERTEETELLLQVKPVSSLKKILYKCEVCSKTFTKKAYAMGHCKNKKVWQCGKCGTEIRNAQNIKRHKVRCSKPKPVKVSNQPGSFKCPDCGNQYPSKTNLLRHRRITHGVEIVGDLQCSDENCTFSCDDPKQMKRHRTFSHDGRPKIKCQKCLHECFSKSGMLKHMGADHSIECSQCDQVCSSEKNLRLHKLRAHKEIGENLPQRIVVRRNIGEHAYHQIENVKEDESSSNDESDN